MLCPALRRLHAAPAWLCLLAALFNLPFVLFQAQRFAFDPYTHIFLADHYRRSWWNLWEPRWYLGFSVASYPPLVHQLIALLSWPLEALINFFAPSPAAYPGAFRWVAEEAAFVGVLLLTLMAWPLAVRAFARIFVGPRAATFAGLLAIMLPALSLTAWAFGQLPTVLGTTCVLFALARGAAFLRSGRWPALLQAVLCAAATAAAHHGVFLFIPFAGLAVALRVALTAQLTSHQSLRLAPPTTAIEPRRGEGAKAPQRLSQFSFASLFLRGSNPRLSLNQIKFGLRLALWGALSALVVVAVIWPFLQWSRGQSLQTPIDHPSRHNLFLDAAAAQFFFWPMYGPLLLAVPAVLWASRTPKRWPLLGLSLSLFVLGLGGTTPLPAWIFGEGWTWLTFDRFSFWAALTLLPTLGAVGVRTLRHEPAEGSKRAHAIRLGFALSLGIFASLTGWWSRLAHAQPPPIDLAPLVQFLNAPAQRPYRYLTLGFGDQMAKLATLVPNGTPDGNYHTARMSPELRASGLGALDTAVWSAGGLRALRPFLLNPTRYGIRWALVAHPDYATLLRATGWQFRFMVGSVGAWENSQVPLRGRTLTPPGQAHSLAALWWGSVPLLSLSLALSTLIWPQLTVARARWAARFSRLRLCGWVLTLSLTTLWWMRAYPLAHTPPMLYLAYDHLLIFACDVVLVFTLTIWGIERYLRAEPLRPWPPALTFGALGLALVAWLSAFNALEPPLAYAFALHLSLLCLWAYLTYNDPPSPRALGWVFGGLLLFQVSVALAQTLAQNTAFLRGWYLPWPGEIYSAQSGASVVQNALGQRWLRAYGTFPHPNHLAGFMLVYVGVVWERYWVTGRARWLILAALGGVTLALAFSRAAWLGVGLVALGAVAWPWLFKRTTLRPEPVEGSGSVRRPLTLALCTLIPLGLTLIPLFTFTAARLALEPPNRLEANSINDRTALMDVALAFIREYPLTGVGAGNFVLTLENKGWQVPRFEPVHNLPLLIIAETGFPGGLAGGALLLAIGLRLWQRRQRATPTERLLALTLLGCLLIGLLDHFWWSQAPGRLLFATVLALWVKNTDT